MPGLSSKAVVSKLLPFLLLAGCATAPTPAVKVEYVDRPVVTQKTCLAAKDVPERPAKLSSGGAPLNVETALAEALAKVSEWTRYGNVADVLMTGCAR